MPQFRKGSSSFGEFVDNKEFSDVTLACADGQLVEVHKVILAGSGPQTTIHNSWFQLVGGFVFRPSWRKKVRAFGNLLNNLGFRRSGLNEKETQESKIRERCSPSPLSNNPTQDGSLLCNRKDEGGFSAEMQKWNPMFTQARVFAPQWGFVFPHPAQDLAFKGSGIYQIQLQWRGWSIKMMLTMMMPTMMWR